MNKHLLEQLIEDRLNDAMEVGDIGSDYNKQAFKEAMEAVDRYIQLNKIEAAEKEQELNRELELKKFNAEQEERKKNKIFRCIEIAGIPLVTFALREIITGRRIRAICNFEKDYTFTTTPGRSIIANLFRK